MTEGNFVDYVKIYFFGKEEKDLRICIEKIEKRWARWRCGMEDMFIL
jgi:hypothetical protein